MTSRSALQIMRQLVAVAVLALIVVCAGRTAYAQTGGLPPAGDTAQKANDGAPTQAKASLPAGPDSSALEPYLVTWILPVGGLISVVIAGMLDRREQVRGGRGQRRAA